MDELDIIFDQGQWWADDGAGNVVPLSDVAPILARLLMLYTPGSLDQATLDRLIALSGEFGAEPNRMTFEAATPGGHEVAVEEPVQQTALPAMPGQPPSPGGAAVSASVQPSLAMQLVEALGTGYRWGVDGDGNWVVSHPDIEEGYSVLGTLTNAHAFALDVLKTNGLPAPKEATPGLPQEEEFEQFIGATPKEVEAEIVRLGLTTTHAAAYSPNKGGYVITKKAAPPGQAKVVTSDGRQFIQQPDGRWQELAERKAPKPTFDQEIDRLLIEWVNAPEVAEAGQKSRAELEDQIFRLDSMRDRIEEQRGLPLGDAVNLSLQVAKTPEEARRYLEVLTNPFGEPRPHIFEQALEQAQAAIAPPAAAKAPAPAPGGPLTPEQQAVSPFGAAPPELAGLMGGLQQAAAEAPKPSPFGQNIPGVTEVGEEAFATGTAPQTLAAVLQNRALAAGGPPPEQFAAMQQREAESLRQQAINQGFLSASPAGGQNVASPFTVPPGAAVSAPGMTPEDIARANIAATAPFQGVGPFTSAAPQVISQGEMDERRRQFLTAKYGPALATFFAPMSTTDINAWLTQNVGTPSARQARQGFAQMQAAGQITPFGMSTRQERQATSAALNPTFSAVQPNTQNANVPRGFSPEFEATFADIASRLYGQRRQKLFEERGLPVVRFR